MEDKKKNLNQNSEQICETQEKIKKVDWQYIFGIITSIAAVVSIIISIITVSQMIKDRNAAYRPSILINPAEYSFSWDKDGNIDWIESFTTKQSIENEMKENSDGTITGTISVPISVMGNGYEQFTAVNVGVGTAKHVEFQWQGSNIENLYDYLIQCDASKEDFLKIDKSVAFNYNGKIVGMGLPSSTSLMYMLPEANEIYDIPLPSAYYLLIQEIIKSGGTTADIPSLTLSVTYSDIQGNEYIDVFLISIKTQLYTEEPTGSGSATFQLVPLFPK